MAPYFIGVDIGTQGARAVLISAKGLVVAGTEQAFRFDQQSREEQSPQEWWAACVNCLKELAGIAKSKINLNDIVAISVTSTSGTVIPLDKHHQPLHHALMYSDQRSVLQAKKATAAAGKYAQGYTAFGTSSGLAKMLWYVDTYPQKAAAIAQWAHPADYITGMLSNCWGITDYTSALKSGYNVNTMEWPAYLHQHLGIEKTWLPKVVPPGTVISGISKKLAVTLGLPTTIQIIAGLTDGCASQIASGAVKPGDWNTTIGTTMVIKGVSKNEITDAEGRIYCHRHPDGFWMPGGASNTGADWVTSDFTDNLDLLNKQALKYMPSGHVAYPLRQQGERFPFINAGAHGFEPAGLSKDVLFTANMEGVACLERYAYSIISRLSNETVSGVYTTGGGSRSDAWLKIRANVLNMPLYKMKYTSGAVGAAILAASGVLFSSVIQAADALTIKDQEIYPEKYLAGQYDEQYRLFMDAMILKQYIKPEPNYA